MEQWKDVVGYEGLYEVSNLGNVRNKQTGKVLKPKLGKRWGYYMVNLYKDNKISTKTIHRLVALAWIPRVDGDKDQINHINEIKTDNRVENLEWCTVEYNNAYGTHNERSYNALVEKGYIKHPERRYLSSYEKYRLHYIENRDKMIANANKWHQKKRVKDLLRQGREVPLWGKA